MTDYPPGTWVTIVCGNGVQVARIQEWPEPQRARAERWIGKRRYLAPPGRISAKRILGMAEALAVKSQRVRDLFGAARMAVRQTTFLE